MRTMILQGSTGVYVGQLKSRQNQPCTLKEDTHIEAPRLPVEFASGELLQVSYESVQWTERRLSDY